MSFGRRAQGVTIGSIMDGQEVGLEETVPDRRRPQRRPRHHASGLPLLHEVTIQDMSTPEAHDLDFLERLCEEMTQCMQEIRAEKAAGKLDIRFSQGEIASLELCDFTPGNAVGAYDARRCAKVAALRVRWFMKQKKSGRVSLIFDQGDISSVQTFQRLTPSKKMAF